jgi:spore coat polysaccharide biosynthesis protein SpsF (cytidylyltransferase family)
MIGRKKMKVIFRITKDCPIIDRRAFAERIRDVWNNTKDLDCMVCFGSDIEVYVVDNDAEVILDDDKDGEAIPIE